MYRNRYSDGVQTNQLPAAETPTPIAAPPVSTMRDFRILENRSGKVARWDVWAVDPSTGLCVAKVGSRKTLKAAWDLGHDKQAELNAEMAQVAK